MKSDDLGSTLHKSICMLMLHDTMSALLHDSALLSRHKHLWVKCHVCLPILTPQQNKYASEHI